jgi:hypothetical protein
MSRHLVGSPNMRYWLQTYCCTSKDRGSRAQVWIFTDYEESVLDNLSSSSRLLSCFSESIWFGLRYYEISFIAI